MAPKRTKVYPVFRRWYRPMDKTIVVLEDQGPRYTYGNFTRIMPNGERYPIGKLYKNWLENNPAYIEMVDDGEQEISKA